jgi:hypothetical protein
LVSRYWFWYDFGIDGIDFGMALVFDSFGIEALGKNWFWKDKSTTLFVNFITNASLKWALI